jgi:hypothetical protein
MLHLWGETPDDITANGGLPGLFLFPCLPAVFETFGRGREGPQGRTINREGSMKLKTMLASFAVAGLVAAFTAQVGAEPYPWMESGPYDPTQTIKARIPAPDGFKRTDAASGSLAEWLRGLPLRPEGSPVRLYPVSQGRAKAASGVHKAVVDLDVLRFQECADAAIRLWAEYLWSAGKAEGLLVTPEWTFDMEKDCRRFSGKQD